MVLLTRKRSDVINATGASIPKLLETPVYDTHAIRFSAIVEFYDSIRFGRFLRGHYS